MIAFETTQPLCNNLGVCVLTLLELLKQGAEKEKAFRKKLSLLWFNQQGCMWRTVGYIVSSGKLSKILLSEVLSLSLHVLLGSVSLVQEGVKAEGMVPSGCQSPCRGKVGM